MPLIPLHISADNRRDDPSPNRDATGEARETDDPADDLPSFTPDDIASYGPPYPVETRAPEAVEPEAVEPEAVEEPVDDPPGPRPEPEPASPPPPATTGLVPVRVASPAPARPLSIGKVLLGFAVLFAVGFGSLWLLDSFSEQEVNGDLIQFAGRAQPAITQFQEATDPDVVHDQLLRRLGWRVDVPKIQNTPLTGLGFAEVMTGISVPVLVYEEPSGGDLAVTIVNYVFLDTHEGVLRFEPEALAGIEHDRSFVVRRSRDQDVLIWRSGDEIFLATGEESAEDLAKRIAVGARN